MNGGPADPVQSYFRHVLSLYESGARLVLESIARLTRGEELASAPQSRDAGAYFSFPDDEDVVRFEQNGYRLFHASEYRDLLRRYHGGLRQPKRNELCRVVSRFPTATTMYWKPSCM